MIGGLMMGPADPDVDLTELEEADETSEDEAFEEQSKSQIGGVPVSYTHLTLPTTERV